MTGAHILASPSGRDEEELGPQVLPAFWFVGGLGVKEAWELVRGPRWAGPSCRMRLCSQTGLGTEVDLADSWWHLDALRLAGAPTTLSSGFNLRPPG